MSDSLMPGVAPPTPRPEFSTVGETLLGRELEKETRAGVEHFKPGQYDAVIYPNCRDFFTDAPLDIARLTYVDLVGHACVVLCMRTPGTGWVPTWAGRAGQTFKEEARPVTKDSFRLSEKMLNALAAGREESLA